MIRNDTRANWFSLGMACGGLLCITVTLLAEKALAAAPDAWPNTLPSVTLAQLPPSSTDRQILEAVLAASERYQVPAWLLACTVAVESHFDPQALGDSGRSLGPVQLHESGLREDFYRSGRTDPTDPNQAIGYLAEQIARDPAFARRNWTGIRSCT